MRKHFFLSNEKTTLLSNDSNDATAEKDDSKETITLGTGLAAVESAFISTEAAAVKFAKPEKYDRRLLDDGTAKRRAKVDAFKSGEIVVDSYTGDTLVLTKAEAKKLYGKDWQKHLAESDHKIPLEERAKQTHSKPWLSNEDVKVSSNNPENIKVVSRKFNNAKRSRTNGEFVTDSEYLKKTDVKLALNGKEQAIEDANKAQKILNQKDFTTSVKNAVETGFSAGKSAAKEAGITGLTISGILNMTAVIKGEKTADEAIADIAVDTGKAAATGFAMGDGLTTISHSLSSSSSKFIKALSASKVPGKIITAVMVTGETLAKYGRGEISARQCLLDLGESGLTFATAGYSMAVGQALIPIPIVGAAVGALVGSMLTNSYYKKLTAELQKEELEYLERTRIRKECERSIQALKQFQAELKDYLESYFKEYHDCFDEALSMIRTSFESGDADGAIAGANRITHKLGGHIQYENMNEFKLFIVDGSTDLL